MRESMNNNIEDEKGLMSVEDFTKMFFTAHGRIKPDCVKKIFSMLLPIILADSEDK